MKSRLFTIASLTYWVLAVAISFFATAFFGYGIAHGAEALLIVFPVVLVLFAFPYWYVLCKKRKGSPIAIALFAPVILVVAAVGYFFMLKPFSEKRIITASLEHMQIENVSDEAIKDASGNILGIRLSYRIKLGKDIPRVTEYANYFPDVSVEDFGILKNEYVKDNTSFNPYSDRYAKAEYSATTDLLLTGVQSKQGHLCKNQALFELLQQQLQSAPPSKEIIWVW